MSEQRTETQPEKEILVAIFPTDGLPEMKKIPHTLPELQRLVGGRIEVFETRLPGVVGICDDEFLFNGEPENLLARVYGARICGTFLLCSERCGPEGTEFASLSPAQVLAILRSPAWPDWSHDDTE